jgi:hypothetical protein
MADLLTSNPLRAETTATTLWNKGTKSVRLIQWIDDAADIVHDSTLTLTINGVALVVKIQPLNDALGFGAVAWEIGPFSPGIPVSDFAVTTMAHGHVHVWI